jgi:hypothetical protein
MEFALDVHTIEKLADSRYVDRLAELIYADAQLIDPLIGLNDDGSLDISFCFEAKNAAAAVSGVTLVIEALAATSSRALDPVGSLRIERAKDREPLHA